MAHRIYCGKIAKKRNSTAQPTLVAYYDVTLKTPTSLHTPTFTISANTFDYNYLQWDDRYYFVTDVVAVRSGFWEVSGVCDVLATFKDDILASTQFVSYSSHKSSIWLPDTRVPLLKETQSARSTASLASILNANGFYVLAATGMDGCRLYMCNESHLTNLLQNVNSWVLQTVSEIDVGSYDFSTVENAIASLSEIMCNSDLLGNAYQQAPQCIRSCIWVPFSILPFVNGAPSAFYLGRYDCALSPLPYYCKSEPVTGSVSVSIPWHYSDWRRGICEDVYLYLPLVGTVQLSGDSLTHVSALTINYSATATDGVISYEVKAGSDTIGVYGGQCSSNYPIGINQQASAGEVMQTAIAGVEKTVAAGIGASISPSSVAASAVGVGMELANTAYQVMNVSYTSHHTTIGGVGGGTGAGLSFDAECFTVAHPTVIDPDDMGATMGLPTMKPMALSGLSGYCQCANAHVAATGAEASELAEIDSYLNSGFFIE